MKSFLIFFCILIGLSFTLHSSNVKADIKTSRECKPNAYINGIDAWPLGCETKFPWKSIEGVWRVDSTEIYLSFKVVTIGSGTSIKRLVDIKQYSNVNCALESWGTGDINSKNTVVKALMTTGYNQYMMTIRAFMESVLQKFRVNGDRAVTVLTLYPLGEQEREQAFKLHKVSSEPVFICRP